ncbi:MAG: PIG-L deacetylase family protein [Mariprofundaceae bacterium]|nr:PIG-L deacetylase family protein [Mariprofundaceae bacterium]
MNEQSEKHPIQQKRTVLALAPHPDDLEIGCGGTLAEHAERGDEVHVFIATFGDVGGVAEVRQAEQEAASKILGVKKIHWGGFPDTQLPQRTQDLMDVLERIIAEVKPDMVYVNYDEDTHQDHRTLAQVARSITRYIPNVLYYETPSSMNFEPSIFMDIHDVLSFKIKALEAHASQVEATHVTLNIFEIALATARFRGVQGKLSCAEAFVPVRLRL